MESAGVQAMCDFRNLELYMFLSSRDLLDAPEWSSRVEVGSYKGTQHDSNLFNIAIKSADYIFNI